MEVAPFDPTVILTLGIPRESHESLTREFRVIETSNANELLSYLAREKAAVVVLGPELSSQEGSELLARCTSEFPENQIANVALCAGATPELFQQSIDEGRLFYLARDVIPQDQLAPILRAAIARICPATKNENDGLAQALADDDRLLEFWDKVHLQADLPGLTRLTAEATASLSNAHVARCFVYDSREEILSGVDSSTGFRYTESAAAGLTAFVARSGERIELDDAASDPRYDESLDNPGGQDHTHFIALPIGSHSGEVLGVLTAVRSANEPRFSQDEIHVFATIAACAAVRMREIRLQDRLQATVLERSRGLQSNSAIFREEALKYHVGKWDQEGGILKTNPTWLNRTHWVMLAILLLGIAYLSIAHIDEYASGPAVVRPRFKVDPTATSNIGTVAGVADQDSAYELIALLPGSYAPQLRRGMPLRLKIDGYPDSNETVAIDRLGSEIVGPREAARAAGRELGDGITLAGPIIVVHAVLPSSGFHANRHDFPYKDGLAGRAEVSVGSERIIVSLVPGLKGLIK